MKINRDISRQLVRREMCRLYILLILMTTESRKQITALMLNYLKVFNVNYN